MKRVYPWYELVEGSKKLEQGDFIYDCPVFHLFSIDKTAEKADGEIYEYDVVVMSQSCDIENKKLDLILVCPIWLLSQVQNNNPFYKSKKGKESLLQGYAPGYHLLNECKINKFEREFCVVDFRNIYGVPFDNLIDIAQKSEKRLRLLPPYREQLSQSFARFFMRVGLPSSIQIEDL